MAGAWRGIRKYWRLVGIAFALFWPALLIWVWLQPDEPKLLYWTAYENRAIAAIFDDGTIACAVKPDTMLRLYPWQDAVCDTASIQLWALLIRETEF